MPGVAVGSICTNRGARHGYYDHRHVTWGTHELTAQHPQERVEEPDFMYVWTWAGRSIGGFGKPPEDFPGDWLESAFDREFNGWWGKGPDNKSGDQLWIVQVEGPVIVRPGGYARFVRGRYLHEVDMKALDDPKLFASTREAHWAAVYPKYAKNKKLGSLVDADRLITLKNVRLAAKPFLAEIEEYQRKNSGYAKLYGKTTAKQADYKAYQATRRQLNQLRKLAYTCSAEIPPLSIDPTAVPAGPLRAFLERKYT